MERSSRRKSNGSVVIQTLDKKDGLVKRRFANHLAGAVAGLTKITGVMV